MRSRQGSSWTLILAVIITNLLVATIIFTPNTINAAVISPISRKSGPNRIKPDEIALIPIPAPPPPEGETVTPTVLNKDPLLDELRDALSSMNTPTSVTDTKTSTTTTVKEGDVITTEKKDPAVKVERSQEPVKAKEEEVPLPKLSGFRGFLSARLISPLIGPKCSTSLLTFHFTDFPCLRLFISKGLGIGLVAGGAVIKAPQMIKIVMKRSAAGVSIASYSLETGAYIAGLAYNVRRGNPFNTYGVHAFMAVANCFVIAAMFHYTNRYRDLTIVLIVSLVFTVSLFSRSITSDALLLSLQWVAILIGVVSKVPQIWENYTTKSTGQLSAVTVGLQTVGSLARCFTTATEVKDPVILITYIVATVLNGFVFWQVYKYWGKPRRSHLD
ncbi:hypothetical protein HDU76_005441 [Blyttiomyces sp. JEL0837]|nr:hypothetical protein HDU76_005441 [Blyttiomyces sp. JEL0837]